MQLRQTSLLSYSNISRRNSETQQSLIQSAEVVRGGIGTGSSVKFFAKSEPISTCRCRFSFLIFHRHECEYDTKTGQTKSALRVRMSPRQLFLVLQSKLSIAVYVVTTGLNGATVLKGERMGALTPSKSLSKFNGIPAPLSMEQCFGGLVRVERGA